MLQKLTRGILFFGVLLLLLIPVNMVLEPKNNTEEAGMYLAKPNQIRSIPEHTIDLLILGDSEAQTCFSPLDLWDKCGIPSFVCSTGSLRMYQLEELFETSLATQTPKVVIFETNAFFREYSWTDVLGFQCERFLHAIRYHDRWKTLTASDFSSNIHYTAPSPSLGYAIHPENKPPKNPDYMVWSEIRQEIPFWNRVFFEKMWKLCRKNEITLIAFSSPSPQNWTYEKHNAMMDYTEQLEIPYFDGNLINLGIDWSTDSMDEGDHLNYSGAVKVTNFFAQYFQNYYNFHDYRNDSSYVGWNDASMKFHQNVEEIVAKLKTIDE